MEEIIALLILPVGIEILSLCRTSRPQLDSHYLPGVAQVLLLQYCRCGSRVDEGWRQLRSHPMHNNLAHSSAGIQFMNQTQGM